MLEAILQHYPEATLDAPTLAAAERSPNGLINDTWLLGERYVLQRLHPIFTAEVNLDIAALTPRLCASSIPVPKLVASDSGKPWVEVRGRGELDGVWRLMTRLPGRTVHRVESAGQARAAGSVFARFHGALREVEHAFAFSRAGVHDTERHVAALRDALERHREPGHRLYDAVQEVAAELLERWAAWGTVPSLPLRIGHGDPKISNLLFDADDRIVGLVDLDTMAHTGLDAELGDALRSWCSTDDENALAPDFDLGLYEAALGGYLEAAQAWITAEEVRAFPGAVERICLELACRFAADALDERYFGWNPQLAEGRGEHNLLRARNQLTLARAVARQRPAMDAFLEPWLARLDTAAR